MMDNKYLWSIIDVLREELSSGTEYGKLQAEIKSLEKLIDAKHKKRNEDSNLIAELKLTIVDQNDDIKTLKKDNKWLANRNGEIIKEKDAWINDLKEEIDELKQCSNVAFVEVLNRSNDKLKAENDSLKDEAVKWNRKYNKVLESRETFKDEALKPTFH